MNKYLILAGLILLVSACGPTPTAVAAAPSDDPVTIPATLTLAPQDVVPTLIVQPTSTAPSAPDASGTLWLQVLSPQDDSVIDTPQVDVIGSAPAGTVISIDDAILLVGDDQQFKTTVTLDEGPNLIEVVASDADGNETSLLLTVTYEP